MTKESEIIELGKRELAKRKLRDDRDRDYAVVAKKFVELVGVALKKGKSCTIVAWAEGKIGKGEICKTSRDPHKIIEKRTGEPLFDGDSCNFNPKFPKQMINSSFRIKRYKHKGLSWKCIELWPEVSTWEGIIINQFLRRLCVPEDVYLVAIYMDCRGVNGAVRYGKKVKGFVKEIEGRKSTR